MNYDSIIRVQHNRDNPYAVMSRKPFEDARLSWKVKGLLAYCLSRPPGWEIRASDLIKRSTDGRESVFTGLRELESAGYLKRRRVPGDSGRFAGLQYLIAEDPALLAGFENSTGEPTETPDAETTCSETPCPVKPTLLISKGLESKTTTTAQEAEGHGASDAAAVATFTETNTYQELAPLVGKKAARCWLEEYGVERIQEVLQWSRTQATVNRGGYIRRALEDQWPEPAQLVKVRERSTRREEQEQIAGAPA